MALKYENPLTTENGGKYLVRPVICREDVIEQAVEDCLDLMFRASYPSITLDEYKEQHKKLKPNSDDMLFESHYLPQKVYDAIIEDFVESYDFRSPLPDIIEILKGYFKDPIEDVWVEKNEKRECVHSTPMDDKTFEEAAKYLDMANRFYNWNRDLNNFQFNVANLSPSSNRETVEKWYHEHGQPDFKLPEDSYWVDGWDE